MDGVETQSYVATEVDRLADRLERRSRILLWGEMGSGKSTLAVALARELTQRSGPCQLLSLDPGTPPFGVPGAVCRGWWDGNVFRWGDCQALCTLNASRFRLPLMVAARRLLESTERTGQGGSLLIDPPGVVRGVGGAELLLALAESFMVEALVVLIRGGAPFLLSEELASLPAAVVRVAASPRARRPSATERSEHRSRLWDRHLANSGEEIFILDRVHLLGTPPPRQAPEAWAGRQAALLDAAGATVRMGEVIRLSEGGLLLRIPPGPAPPSAILIRDAGRNSRGRLATIAHVDSMGAVHHEPAEMTPPTIAPGSGDAPVSSRVGPAWATLVGGVFGDPLLHVRLRNLKQSFLFDLGNPGRLAAKVAHQVSAVFLSHAHLDHIGGFLWFLRSRIGPFGPCKIFGPAETIVRIAHFLGAITWDRIEENAPVFEVCEIDGAFLKRARLQPGRQTLFLPELPVEDGIVLTEESFHIRAVVCDHKIPSVAYGLVFSQEISVRKEKLEVYGWPPGPWLGRLKQCIASERLEAELEVPDGTVRTAGELAEALTIIGPGKKLVYAADMADSPENRKKLIDLARSAHTFFCETGFTTADREKAEATQHLTTLAAIEIARQAGVKRLAPFHFSKRYERDPGLVYDEILAAAGPLKILGHFS